VRYLIEFRLIGWLEHCDASCDVAASPQEWELEKQQATVDQVLPVLREVAQICQIEDKAFWPQRLAHSMLPHVSEPAPASEAADEEDEPLTMLGLLPRYAVCREAI
jgi:hypothetical protein